MQSARAAMTWPISLTWHLCIIFQTIGFVFQMLCCLQGCPISNTFVSKPQNLLHQICFFNILICGFLMLLSHILTHHKIRFYHARKERLNFRRDLVQKLCILRYRLIRGTISWYTHTYGINISINFSLNLVHYCTFLFVT